MSSPLLNNPLEVILQITSYLTTPEFGHLRASCKQLEGSLSAVFAKEFFSKRQFSLTEFSIQTLLDISKSRFGPGLTHLIIHLEHPASILMTVTQRQQGLTLRGHNEHVYQYLSHSIFTSTGRDLEMLSEAIQHLPNLETIGMRDFNSKRTRDLTLWHSYGSPTLNQRTSPANLLGLPGIRRPQEFRTNEYTNHVFLAIVRAIAASAASGHNPRLTRLEVLLHRCHFSDSAFVIPPQWEDGITLGLGKLTTILIDGLTTLYHDRPYMQFSPSEPEPNDGYFLTRFLLKATALEHLRLNFPTYDRAAIQHVLAWLANTSGRTSLDTTPENGLAALVRPGVLPMSYPNPPTFRNLRRIDIGMATVKLSTLVAVYKEYKTSLRAISLHKSNIECGLKANVLERLCHKLVQIGVNLREFNMSYLDQHSGRIRSQVKFLNTKNNRVMSWRGTAFSQSIADITNNIELEPPIDGDVTMDDDDDYDDDGDDDDTDSLESSSEQDSDDFV
ncbi:hypothetical protein GGS20DRAFT_547537 [Poronia punctata]|nr:hypothetical protein GGS20DRAFT_547537 [Poronia punctata]